jgi:hypothetical protein
VFTHGLSPLALVDTYSYLLLANTYTIGWLRRIKDTALQQVPSAAAAAWSEGMGATCIACGIGINGQGFTSSAEQRQHFKTDWHRLVAAVTLHPCAMLYPCLHLFGKCISPNISSTPASGHQ